ncbi:hypothetical protein LDL36_20535 [Komagataeibacter sp. FNDCR1]|nr:hypothetical protein [Komagataeibacter sp. FNDCR1]
MIRFGQVVAVYPEIGRVDLVDLDSGIPVGNAIVLSADGSTDGGSWSIPDVPRPPAGRVGGINPDGRTMIAAYEFGAGARAVVHGFARFAGSQIVFKQQDRTITRHAASGAYTTIAPDGSIEAWHPSGTYFRIGTGGHEDLTDLCAANWGTPQEAPEPTVTLATPNFSFVVAPGGNVTSKFSTWKMSGPVEVDGPLTVKDSIAASGDVTANGISLESHTHTDSTGGETSKPAG